MSKVDEEAAEKVCRELQTERAHLDKQCTRDDVEQTVQCCQETVSKVQDSQAKKLRICARLKSWWNSNIKQRRSELGREKGRGRKSEAAPRAKADLQKSIQHSKSRTSATTLVSVRNTRVFRIVLATGPTARFGSGSGSDPELDRCNGFRHKTRSSNFNIACFN
jgi:hypothetical protein